MLWLLLDAGCCWTLDAAGHFKIRGCCSRSAANPLSGRTSGWYMCLGKSTSLGSWGVAPPTAAALPQRRTPATRAGGTFSVAVVWGVPTAQLRPRIGLTRSSAVAATAPRWRSQMCSNEALSQRFDRSGSDRYRSQHNWVSGRSLFTPFPLKETGRKRPALLASLISSPDSFIALSSFHPPPEFMSIPS